MEKATIGARIAARELLRATVRGDLLWNDKGMDAAAAIIDSTTGAKEMLEALERVEQDLNWMLNNRQFLNCDVFGYLDGAIRKARGQ